MKKKLISVLLIMIMCVSVLTGCSLVSKNLGKYYEAVVCTITYGDGEVETISKRDLISAYNSYGYYYVSSYGYTQKEAVEQTLEILIEQRLTIKEVKGYYETLGEDLLNDRETTYLWDTTYDTLVDNLKTYYNSVVGISDSEDSDDSTTSSSVFSEYEKNAYLTTNSNGNYIIKKTTSATTTRATYEIRKDGNGNVYDFEFENADGEMIFQELMYEQIISLTEGTTTSAKNWKSAFNNYLADVKDSYSYKTFENNKECFLFEMERVYKILRDNYLVEKYSEIYNTANHQDADDANVTVSDILKYYSAKVSVDYTDYVINGNTSNFESNILSDVGSVDYILGGANATNYFYVGYVKMEFSDEQQALYDLYQEDYYNEIDRAELVQKLYDSVVAKIRDAETGEETGQTISATKLLAEINTKLAQYQYKDCDVEWQKEIENGYALAEDEYDSAEAYQNAYEAFKAEIEAYNKTISYAKAEVFRDYLYLYSDDDTLKGADYNAVFGVTQSGEVLSDSFSDDDAVNEAIKQLYNGGNVQIGDTTDLVQVDDGYYIFFYAGKIENLFAVNGADFDISTDENNILVLSSTRVNIFSEKTLFDVLYDELTTDNFSVFQNMNMQKLRSQTKSIVVTTNNIKDLY